MKSFFIILLIIFPAIIFAQSNYQPGYVLKNNGDTLKGYINYTESSYSRLSIKFKVSKADKIVQQFTPLDIKAFQITGFENYVSYKGDISTNKNVVPDLPVGLDTGTIKGAVFLKPLIVGQHLALFYNNEPSKNRFFIAEKNEPPIELKYYPYYKGADTIVEHYTYRGQLLLYNSKYNDGNPQLTKLINDVVFTEGDLEKIVGLINDNGVDKPIQLLNAYKKPSAFRFFAGIGANNISTTYNYKSYNPAIPTDLVQHSSSVTPKFSLGADYFIKRYVQNIVLRIEASYTYGVERFDHSVPAGNATFRSYSLVFTEHTIMLTPQVLFNIYNKNKLKIYIDGGLSINSTSTPDDNPIVSNGSGGTRSLYHFSPIWSTYSFQAGLVLARKVEFAFNFTNSIPYVSTYPDVINISNRSNCFSVKYLIGGN